MPFAIPEITVTSRWTSICLSHPLGASKAGLGRVLGADNGSRADVLVCQLTPDEEELSRSSWPRREAGRARQQLGAETVSVRGRDKCSARR
jgi:hypothetical protein